MNNSPRSFHIDTPSWDELDAPPSVTPADATRMTAHLDAMVSPVPQLLKDALTDSETAGLAKTMLRVTHHLSYWEKDGKIMLGGKE